MELPSGTAGRWSASCGVLRETYALYKLYPLDIF